MARIRPGLLAPVLYLKEIVEFFNYLIDDQTLNLICQFTNKRIIDEDSYISLDELRYF